jgi:hypothetical protein
VRGLLPGPYGGGSPVGGGAAVAGTLAALEQVGEMLSRLRGEHHSLSAEKEAWAEDIGQVLHLKEALAHSEAALLLAHEDRDSAQEALQALRPQPPLAPGEGGLSPGRGLSPVSPVEGSIRYVEGSIRYVEGSPTRPVEGSPIRSMASLEDIACPPSYSIYSYMHGCPPSYSPD